MVVGSEIIDQRVETYQLRLVLGVSQLILITLHQRIYLGDLLEEVLDLFLMPLELAKLLVEVEDDPNCLFVEFLSIFILAVFGDHWDIIALLSDQTQHFEDPDFCIFLSKESRVLESLLIRAICTSNCRV